MLAPKSHEPTDKLSPLPLVASCAAIVLAAVLWLAIQRWSEASERDTAARAMTGGDPTQAVALRADRPSCEADD
jgi:hypothetical protein